MERQVYDRMRALEADHWWFSARREILSSQIGALPLPRGARILEAGCGPGGNLAMLAAFGEVVGLEPDAETRAYAAQRSGVRIEGGLLPADLPFEPETFDLVCAFDVIEHVDEDAAAVAALAALARPGGFLATTVPAQPWMWSRHDELHHHRRRYRMAPYRRLFQAAGLAVVKASHFNAALFPAIAAIRLAKLATGSSAADDDAAPAPRLNALLAAIFGAERFWLSRAALPFGVSILLIARKPA
ncbi:MAG TPA: class I SAM-dependent methyltransferase [Caulobacteraceae bacterium]|nr:class I SAM-dependent methyltransferase [Caulobacteraceae bacterium]